MRVYIAGQKLFGQTIFQVCRAIGFDVAGVCAPPFAGDGQRPDRLRDVAERAGVAWLPSGKLTAETLPLNVDLIISAHSHDFIGKKTRLKTRLGAIGYHPSLLPLHRGRDAIEWTIRMRDRVAGGSVYWLSDEVDAGDLAAQEHVIIKPDDTAVELWRRELFPLGVRLLRRVLTDISCGELIRVPQERLAGTWEPAIGRPPMFRPELPLLGKIDGFEVRRERSSLDRS